MKTILELLATHNTQGESLIHTITDKINRVLGCQEYPFQLSNSGSRDSSQGSTYDLRNAVGLADDDSQIKEIRELLANLQQSSILAFEEKHDFNKKTTSFVITHVDEDKLLNANDDALRVHNPVFSSADITHHLIRVGHHQVNVSYKTVKPAASYEALILHTRLISDSEQSSGQMGLINPSQLQNIAYYLTVDKYLAYVLQLINSCMKLDNNSGFKLYLQSSNPDYPIDLRVYLPSNHPEIENIRAKLTGFSLLNKRAVVFEEKMATGTDVAIFIIKELMPARLLTYLEHANLTQATPDKLNEILALLRELFTDNRVIRDMSVHTGVSVSRPYPHIRCQNFYPEIEVLHTLELLSDVLGKPSNNNSWNSDKKPQTCATKPEPGGYKIFRSAPQELQLIIDIHDLDRVEEQLRESLTSSSSSEPR